MLFPLRHKALSLRSITDADSNLLFAIYASTREIEMQRVPHWTYGQKKYFLLQQFNAQHNWYQQQYIGAYFLVIEANGEPAGRLYLAPAFSDGSVRIIDIALLSAYRNKGYGESILRDVMAFAKENGRTVTIHVESFNPAKQLYQRLGFELADQKNDVYHLYRWQADETKHLPNDVQYT